MHSNISQRPHQGSSGKYQAASLRAINKFKHPLRYLGTSDPQKIAKTGQGIFAGLKKKSA